MGNQPLNFNACRLAAVLHGPEDDVDALVRFATADLIGVSNGSSLLWSPVPECP